MTILNSSRLLHLSAAATAVALALPALPVSASGSDVAPPARTLQLACPADRVTGSGFADTAASVHGGSIECLAWYGIAQGTGTDTFDGSRAVTRAQLATFLTRVLEHAGVSVPADAADAFLDDEASTHEQALNVLAALGIVKGDGAGQVDPDVPVRRDQMASLLVRVLELIEGGDLADAVEDYFEDDDDNAHHGAINALAGLGIAAGRSQGVFDPAAEVRRDQLATFLMRLVDRLVEHEEVRVPLTLRLSAEHVAPGDVVQGEVIGDGVESVALSGCGVDGAVADENAEADGMQFSFVVPATFPAKPAEDGTQDGSEDSAADGGAEAVDECELGVIVAYVGGGTVTLDGELEYGSAEDSGKAAPVETPEDESAPVDTPEAAPAEGATPEPAPSADQPV